MTHGNQRKDIHQLTKKEKLFLKLLHLLNEISGKAGTKSYIFGGLTLDIWHGRFLRDHYDIDVLTENLHSLEPEFVEQFSGAGYETHHLGNNDFKAIKDEVKIHFGHLDIKNGSVEWTHDGENGSIFFPEEWLDRNVHYFYYIETFTITPEFEYVLKMHPELMNPEWTLREKDQVARMKLAEMLSGKYGDLSILRKRVKPT